MLRTALLAIAVAGPLALCGADFWQEKQPSDWTDKDVKRLLTKSPWAKDASVNWNTQRTGSARGGGIDASDAGSGRGGRGGMGMGGGGARSGGGTGMGHSGGTMGDEGSGMPALPRVLVRWESAAPLRHALAKAEWPLAKQIDAWTKEFYVVTASGISGNRRGGPEQQDPQRMQQVQERLKQTAALKCKGRDAISPTRVALVDTPDGRIAFYLFPRAQAITAEDKEVSFESAIGPLGVRVKFALKDMVYQGNLEL